MNIQQKNKDMMGNSVTQIFIDNESTWTGSELFAETVNQHKLNMASIRDWSVKQQQQLEMKGLVKDKNLLRSVMVETEMVQIIAALKSVGATTKNNSLITSVNISRSVLLKKSDTWFNTFAGTLKKIANEHSAAILPLDITAETLNHYSLSCASFDSIMGKPKAMKSLLKTYTKNLGAAVLNMVSFLKSTVDNQVISLYHGTDFLSSYFNSRTVYHLNEERTVLGGTVKAENGHYIKNAIVELVNYPTPGESIFRHTNIGAYWSFKQLDLTSATIRIRAEGYITAEYTVPIKQLKTNNFDIVMMADPAFAAVQVLSTKYQI